MKKQLLKSALIAVAGVGLLAGSAMALPTINISATGYVGSYTVADETADDQLKGIGLAGDGVVQYSSLNFGDFAFELSSGTTKPLLGSASAPMFHLNLNATAKAGKETSVFTVMFSETDFTIPGGIAAFVASLGGNDSFYTFDVYYSLSNTLFAIDPANQIADLTTTGITGVQSNWSGNINGPFSITVVGSMKGSGSIDAGLTPVPEPATMLLFGTGVAGLAGIARRRKAEQESK